MNLLAGWRPRRARLRTFFLQWGTRAGETCIFYFCFRKYIFLNLQISVTLTRWQYKIFLLTWIEGVLIGFHHLSSVFLGYTPKHWCKLGHFRSNNQHRQVHSEIHPSIPTTYRFERSIPFNDASSTVLLSSLKMFFTLTNAQLSPSRPFGTLLVNIKEVQRAGFKVKRSYI